MITGAIFLVFNSIGLIIRRSLNKSIIFDKRYGYFWKGKYDPRSITAQNRKNFIKLDDIYALQIISELIRSSSGKSTSYELNLVLKDASRYNVVDYGHRSGIREDARVIGKFLNIQVWDKTLRR